MEKSAFLADIEAIRQRARQHLEAGAVTKGYKADREAVLELLNGALATEIVCVLRYKHHYFTAQGPNAKEVRVEFAEHAAEEQEHADRIAERITQLGGKPNLSPTGLATRSHSEYVEGRSITEMLKEDLVAERIAIEIYTRMVDYLGDRDPTTRRLIEEILAKEEEHAEDLSTLLGHVG